MQRFALFVDGSNLFGVLKHLALNVDDYEAFFHHIFEQAVEVWRGCFESGSTAEPVQLRRVYWYVVGGMDEWDLSSPEAVKYLEGRFAESRDLKALYMARIGKEVTGASQEEVARKAWEACLADFKAWYEQKSTALEKMRRFYYAVRSATDFIDIDEAGHWKVDFDTRSVSEKGLDTSLAVDMVRLIDNYDVAVLVTGDADMIPSMRHVKTRGKQVGAVEFKKGSPPEKRGKNFSSRLKLTADFVAPVYETDLLKEGVAVRDPGAGGPVPRAR